MELTTAAWDALEDFMQRNEYLIDREYVNACRHYARTYDRDEAFDVWQSALNRYAPYIQEISRVTQLDEDRLPPTTILTDDSIRSSLTHLANRIPVYALMRNGKTTEVLDLLHWITGQGLCPCNPAEGAMPPLHSPVSPSASRGFAPAPHQRGFQPLWTP